MTKLIDGLTVDQLKTVNQGIGWLICELGGSEITHEVRRILVRDLQLGHLDAALISIGYEEYCDRVAANAINARSTVDIQDPADHKNLNYSDVINDSLKQIA